MSNMENNIEAQQKPQSKRSSFREYAESIVIALVFALIVRTFLLQAFTIPSGSMLKTVQIGDYVLVNKFTYGVKIPFTDKYLFRGSDPQLGDIIVFKYPVDPGTDFIKRVVGTPGDVIEMRNKQLYRNGEAVKESYIQHVHPSIIGKLDNMPPFKVPEDSYFVMGDNRDNSLDSREWGVVPRKFIHGKAWRLYWSWDKETHTPRLSRLGMLLQ